MKTKARVALASGTAIAAVAILAPAAGAAARSTVVDPARSTAPVRTHVISPAAQRATLSYWTPVRQRAAKPVGVLAVGPGQVTRAPRADAAAAGKPTVVNGVRPTASYTSFAVPTNLYTVSPYDLNGRIFFSYGGSEFSCSGTSVASYHGRSLENEVWTAGHCVANVEAEHPGAYASDIEFIPAYDGDASTASGQAPFGEFTATSIEVPTAWLDKGDLSVDEGAFTVGTNSAGKTLGQTVGAAGFIYNQSDSEAFTTFGYPAASPYTGKLMIEDLASSDILLKPSGATGQAAIGIPSPMTNGSSGGAWSIDWSTTSPGYIDGHNDFTNGAYPGIMFSPYQDLLANEVRCFGATSC